MVGASTGLFGAVWAQAELRKVLGAIGARVRRPRAAGRARRRRLRRPTARLADDEQRLILADVVTELLDELQPAEIAA